ncbi:MAG: hypothetical protein GY811_00090 [Myxococcales bacterium]|nr:hypothetical protein [Myxococcales bacterium]
MKHHAPLDTSSLSAEAQRALSSGPAKMMAARGMAPLANPVDLTSVLYQLCVATDEKIQGAAQGSARGLPKAILAGALADTTLDPMVIDYFVTHADCRAELVDIVILNQSSADSTIATLAANATDKQVELISENQQRILGCTDIISAIYANPHARMSTVDRIVELAVRQGLKVPGIAAWDELSRAVMQTGDEQPAPDSAEEQAADNIFLSLVPEEQEGEPEDGPTVTVEEAEIQIRDMTIPAKIRLAMMGNKFQRSQLIKDPKKLVSMAVIKSPSVKDNEAAGYASNTALAEDVIGYIATKKEWVKLYHIKLALVNNPKCPLPTAMRLLPHLRAKDLGAMARSRSIPSALSAQARKLSAARRGGSKKK